MRIIKFKYRLLDKKENMKRLLKVVKCSISHDSLAKLKYSASLTIENSEDIDFNDDLIQVSCSINSVEDTIATLLISNSRKVYGSYSREIECFDKLLILEENKLKERLTIKAGSNIIDEVIKQLQGAKHKITLQSYVTKVDADFEIGTSRLDVINYLLKIVNYESLYSDKDGYFVTRPYILPENRKIDIEYNDISDSDGCLILEDTQEEIDLFNIPNVFVRATNNSQIAPLRTVYINNNPNSLSSTVNRGREIVDFKTVDDVLDYQTLYNIAQKDAVSASNIYKNITLKTGINIGHGFLNCVKLNVKSYKINDKFIETSWKIDDCNVGGTMEHSLRRLINV